MGETNIDKSKENPNEIISPADDSTLWFTTELVFGDVVYFLFGSFGYRFSVDLPVNIMAARHMKLRI